MANSYCRLSINVRKKSAVQASVASANRYSLSTNWPREDEEDLPFALPALAAPVCGWWRLVEPPLLSVNETAR